MTGKLQVCKPIFFKLNETIKRELNVWIDMNTTGKIAIGVSFASSVLLAAWLLTGQRKEKTKDFVYKGAESLKNVLKSDKIYPEDSDVYYI